MQYAKFYNIPRFNFHNISKFVRADLTPNLTCLERHLSFMTYTYSLNLYPGNSFTRLKPDL